MKYSPHLTMLAIALALGSGCTSFHGYETSFPKDVRPSADVGGPYRIAELTSMRVGKNGTALPGVPEISCPAEAMTKYLAEKYPGTFSQEESATPLVVRQTIAHGNTETSAGQAFVATFLTLGFTPSKSLIRKSMTTAFLLPSEETTEPLPWEVRIKHLYNVNILASGAYSTEKGWYRGFPLEASLAAGGITGSKDPVIAADFEADNEYGTKILGKTATEADNVASSERSFWRQVSPDVGSARWREYAGAAIVETLNRLSPEERTALKNNLAAQTAAGDASLLDGLFADYPLRKPGAPLGRDALIGTWEGDNDEEVINSGFPKGSGTTIPPRQSKHVHSTYEFKADGTVALKTRTNGSDVLRQGTWSYADGKLTTVFPINVGDKTYTATSIIAWFGQDELEIRQIAETKKETYGTTTTTVEENGVYTSILKFGNMKTVIRGTPTALKRKK